MMNFQISLVFLMASIQVACCSQAFSYPIMANVSRIEVTNELNASVKEIKDSSQIDNVIRFIDERRERWCSPRFGSIPRAKAMLRLYRDENGKGDIGFGDRFFVVKLAGGTYKMDISDGEEKEFLQLLGVSQADVFSN